jgi:hypothetical protein
VKERQEGGVAYAVQTAVNAGSEANCRGWVTSMRAEHAELPYGEAHQCRQKAAQLARRAKRLDTIVDNGLVEGGRADRLLEGEENARDQAPSEAA